MKRMLIGLLALTGCASMPSKVSGYCITPVGAPIMLKDAVVRQESPLILEVDGGALLVRIDGAHCVLVTEAELK